MASPIPKQLGVSRDLCKAGTLRAEAENWLDKNVPRTIASFEGPLFANITGHTQEEIIRTFWAPQGKGKDFTTCMEFAIAYSKSFLGGGGLGGFDLKKTLVDLLKIWAAQGWGNVEAGQVWVDATQADKAARPKSGDIVQLKQFNHNFVAYCKNAAFVSVQGGKGPGAVWDSAKFRDQFKKSTGKLVLRDTQNNSKEVSFTDGAFTEGPTGLLVAQKTIDGKTSWVSFDTVGRGTIGTDFLDKAIGWIDIEKLLVDPASSPATPPQSSPAAPPDQRHGSLWINESGDLVHPDAPGGAGGAGFFRSARSLGFGADDLGLPHPRSSAARILDPLALAKLAEEVDENRDFG